MEKGLFKKKEKGITYEVTGQVEQIPIGDIQPNPQQPRKTFDRVKLLELSESIAQNGILQPLIVTIQGGRPILLSGERRLRAAKIAGLKTVPCVRREADEMGQALLAMIENIQREDMDCFETAGAIRHLIDTYHLTQEEAALRLGYSQSAVANKLRLLRLSEEERRALLEAGMTERHARTLLRLDGRAMRQVALERMIKGKMTVAQSERLVEDLLAGRVRRRPAKPLVRDVRVFFNTVNHALDIMRRGGIPAESQRREEEEYIEYIVRIPRESCMRTTG
jgi:ParB family chromosome partitioning protein